MTASENIVGKVRKWTYEETKMAFALYMMNGVKKCDDNSSEVIKLATALGRTPAAVALKVQNIVAHDPRLPGHGLEHGSKYDERIWIDYFRDPYVFLDHCIAVLTDRLNRVTANGASEFSMLEVQPVFVGVNHSVESTQRYGQDRLRNIIFNNYHERCCLTGMTVSELLIVSHIKPWAVSSPSEKVLASNALLLNAFHDKAFDKGIITINQEYEVVVWDELEHSEVNEKWLYSYAGKRIELPKAAVPDSAFIDYHNRNIFRNPSQFGF